MKRKNTVDETNNDYCIKSDVSKDAIDLSKGHKCVGVVNSTHGSEKKLVPLVRKCVRVRPNSAHEFDYFQGQPAIFSKKCDGVGEFKSTYGGLSCYQCVFCEESRAKATLWIGCRSETIKSWECWIKENPKHMLNQTCIDFNAC